MSSQPVTSRTDYVPYSDSVEVEQPNEAEDTQAAIDAFREMSQFAFEKHRHASRGAHAKSHGILKGELQVYDNLPEELRQGLFKTARTYPVILRYSTAPGDIAPDGIAAFRGLAIKVIGVEGAKISSGSPEAQNAATQDFLMVNGKAFAVADIAAFSKQIQALAKVTKQPEELQRAATTLARAGSATLRAVGVEVVGGAAGVAMPETHILGETYATTAALRFGDYVAKLSAVPVSENLKALTGESIDTGNPSVLRDLVVEFFRDNSAEYELCAQLCTNLEKMPVEDASIEWPEDESPYRPVARITIPAQEAYSPARRVYGDDVLTFTPFNCLAEHRPLGSVMRARQRAYEDSSRYRHEMNAQQRREPQSIDELPD